MRPNSWAPEWLPYTIVGEDQWQDYEVSADIYLNKGDSAGVMGRINDVGSGWGSIPKGYFLQLDDDGQSRLVVVRGKEDKKTPVGDAEQQALIKAQQEDTQGGEKVLGSIRIPNVGPNQWHNLKIRFEGSTITGWIDNQKVLSVSDKLYKNGMDGLLAGGQEQKLSTPYFDNLKIDNGNASVPDPNSVVPRQSPIYP